MKENKRPWTQLLNAAIWAGLFWMKLDSYTDLLSVHNEVFSPEEWQEFQGEYMVMFLLYGYLALLSLLRFFLYNRKAPLLWAEAITLTFAFVCGAVGLSLHPVTTGISVYLFGALLLAVCVWSWYDLRKHYRTPA